MLLRCLLLLAIFICAKAGAVTLDWDTVTWTAGTLNNSYNVDPGTAGNDVTIAIAGDTGQLVTDNTAPNPQTPAIRNTLEGGLTPAQNTLVLAVNFSAQTQAVTVTVTFNALYTQGVKNVSFKIFDVDFSNTSATSNFQDELRSITATRPNNNTVAATITAGTANAITGTGVNQVVDGNATSVDAGTGSDAGNVTISFGNAAIKSFTFTYGSGTGVQADPTFQHIGIFDLTFVPVPEMNPALATGLSCAAAALLTLLHRQRVRRRNSRNR